MRFTWGKKKGSVFSPMQDTGALCCQFPEYHGLAFFLSSTSQIGFKLLLVFHNYAWKLWRKCKNKWFVFTFQLVLPLSRNKCSKVLHNLSALCKWLSSVTSKHNAEQIAKHALWNFSVCPEVCS